MKQDLERGLSMQALGIDVTSQQNDLIGPLPSSTDVCLVSMPFAPLPRPLPALGLLEAALKAAGIRVTGCYFNLWFARLYGSRYHDWPYKALKFYLADWLFGAAAFGPAPDKDETYLRALTRYLLGARAEEPAQAEAFHALCVQYRQRATDFTEQAARYLIASGARVIGCSSNFQQHGASLALLRAVKRLAPERITLLGGANCEGPMGAATHRCFPWVDYVVSGEGEEVIAPLVKVITVHGRDLPLTELPAGVWAPANRQAGKAGYERPHQERFASCTQLDKGPIADYQSYFDWLGHLGLRQHIRIGIPIEGSRGCWWGRCAFCGLNGERLRQRTKPLSRVLEEMDAFEQRHQCRDFELLDNVPPPRLLRELTQYLGEQVGEQATRRRLFCEVRAGMNREQIRALALAGIHYVQAGVEGLHSDLLALMNKGTQAWQNVQLLKWTREFGILCTYNLLWGMPGAQDRWYAETAAWLPAIEHLAPGVLLGLRFDRFSDYHRNPQAYGLRLQPHPSMPLVYPLADDDLAELSYFFEDAPVPISADGHFDLKGVGAEKIPPEVMTLLQATQHWVERFFRSRLQPILARSDSERGLELLDTRQCAVQRLHLLHDQEAQLYRLIDAAPPIERVQAKLAQKQGLILKDAEFDRMRAELIDARLAIELDGRLIGLAIRGEQPALPSHKDFPGGRVIRPWRGVTNPGVERLAGYNQPWC